MSTIKVADLTPAKYNPRKISTDKLKSLKDALLEFGDLSGIVFNRRSGNLVGGHQRCKVIPPDAEINITETYDPPTRTGTVVEGYIILDGERYSYREVDWDDAKEKAANIAANKQGGEWDDKALNQLIKELSEMPDIDIGLTGFEKIEIDKILSDLQQAETKTQHQSEFKALTPFEIDDRIKKEIEAAARIVVQYSGGKDSSYSLLKILPWLDLAKTEAVYVDTGAEYPDLMVHIQQFCESAGVKLTVLKSPKNWHEIYGPKKKFPDPIFRDCIDPLINHPINKYGDTLGPNVLYIRGGMKNQKISRGARKGKTDLIQIIAGKYKILNPIYYIDPKLMKEEIQHISLWPGYARGFQRTCCWTCPFQKVEHWEAMKKWYPMLWERMKEMVLTFEFKLYKGDGYAPKLKKYWGKESL